MTDFTSTNRPALGQEVSFRNTRKDEQEDVGYYTGFKDWKCWDCIPVALIVYSEEESAISVAFGDLKATG